MICLSSASSFSLFFILDNLYLFVFCFFFFPLLICSHFKQIGLNSLRCNRDYAGNKSPSKNIVENTGKMRKKKLLLTGILLLVIWASVQLYLFVQRPQYQIFKSPRSWFSYNNSTNQTSFVEEDVQSHTTPKRNSFDLHSISDKVQRLEHDLSEQIKSNEGLLRILRVLTKLTSSIKDKSPEQIEIERQFIQTLQNPNSLKVSFFSARNSSKFLI